VNFYQAFVDGDRWKLYLRGVGTTVEVTILALVLGVVLGVLVAVIRTSHDQQRPGGATRCWALPTCCARSTPRSSAARP
jgi:ABC-type amino acid transport system permease subunit